MFIFTNKMSLAVNHIHAITLVTTDSYDIDREAEIRLDPKRLDLIDLEVI